jgi:hypothetical protein
MLRALKGVCAVAVIWTVAAAGADEPKAAHQIKDGIAGKVRSVDPDKDSLTVVLENGRTQTFTITDETTMLGPRGGKVRRRLKDPRFHEGFPVVVVASGGTATEVHLGYAKDATEGHDATKRTDTGRAEQPRKTARPADTEPTKTEPTTEPTPRSRIGAKARPAAREAEQDEDNEVPGRIKRVDPERRILVITLVNGKDRSFLLAKDTKIMVRGAASQHGLEDPALKTGAHIEVITDEGGHKVKEVKVLPVSRLRKAG